MKKKGPFIISLPNCERLCPLDRDYSGIWFCCQTQQTTHPKSPNWLLDQLKEQMYMAVTQ